MDSLYFCKKYKKDEYEYRLGCSEVAPFLKGIHGEKFIVSFTEEINGMLGSIQLMLSNINSKNCNYSESVLLEAHSSATIEGCRTTVDSVKRSILSKNPSKNDKMVINIIKAQSKYYNEKVRNLSDIVSMWRIISDGVCENMDSQGGLFRDKMVYVGNENKIIHTPEVPDKILDKMKLLEAFINSHKCHAILKGIIIHYYIEYIHPMCDCNGRLGRLLQNVIIYQEGYKDIIKVPVIRTINNYIPGYYSSFKNSECVVNADKFGKCIDITPFIYYMLNILLEAISRVFVNLNKKEKLVLEKMSKRGVGAEITVSNAMFLLKMDNRDSIRSILNKLADKGYLVKRKCGNKNIYRLIKLLR